MRERVKELCRAKGVSLTKAETNLDVRLLISEKNLSCKDIAKKMQIRSTSLSRMLMSPLTQKQREKILSAIQEMEKAE